MADLWGYDRIEVSDVSWGFEKYAQFLNAARVQYTKRGKRKRQTAMVTTIPMVILNGWGHPDPPPKYGPPQKISEHASSQTTRRPGGDPEWANEFNAFLYGYLAGSKATVLIDFRKHDPMKPPS